MQVPMKIDADGLAHLEALEQCRLVAYWDENGWAIGYGQHRPDITKGFKCSLAEAKLWILQTTDNISDRLSTVIKVPLNQGQFNALVIFTYNIGLGAFTYSHLLSGLNSGNYTSVPDQMRRWIYSNGEVNEVLESRRETEIAIWNSQDAPTQA